MLPIRRLVPPLAGLVALTAPAVAAADAPGLDCAAAATPAESAICANAALVELDAELARVYRLALTGPHASAAGAAALAQGQGDWLLLRDDCVAAGAAAEACLAAAYASRIDALRTGFADARVEGGASLGPFAYACDGLGAGLSATFVNTAEPLVSLRWGDMAIVLPIAMSGSGARYATADSADDGSAEAAEFWIKGDEAMFTPPGGASVSCRLEPAG